jgi:hypothetical protein
MMPRALASIRESLLPAALIIRRALVVTLILLGVPSMSTLTECRFGCQSL